MLVERDRYTRAADMPAFRQPWLLLQRGQTRSPAHSLSKVVPQRRQLRRLRLFGSVVSVISVSMANIWVRLG
jgi:hypothetical protein